MLEPHGTGGDKATRMEAPLRILHLEDDVDYAALVAAWLKEAGISAEITAVQDLESFQQALERNEFDLILSDYHLPRCTGLDALAVARTACPDTPFVLASGTAGEAAAIESLRQGATDYVLKQWTDRLVPTIRRALHQAQERKRLRRLQEEVERRERVLRALTENVLDLVVLLDGHGRIAYASPSAELVLGYPHEGLAGQDWFEFVHPEDVGPLRACFEAAKHAETPTCRTEFRMCHRNGQWRLLEAVVRNRIEEPDLAGLVMTCRDITERKEAELQAATLARLGGQLNAAPSFLEAARAIARAASDLLAWDAFVLALWDAKSQRLSTVLAVDTVRGQRVEIPPDPAPQSPSPLALRVLEEGPLLLLREPPLTHPTDTHMFGDVDRPSASLLWAPIRHAGQVEGLLSVQSYRFAAYQQSHLRILVSLADHCSGALARLRAEQALRRAERRYRGLFENSPDAILVLDMEGRVRDANAAAGQLAGAPVASLLGRSWLEFVPPEERPALRMAWQQENGGRPPDHAEGHWLRVDGRSVPVELLARPVDHAGEPSILLHVRDVSARKQAESALRESERLFFSVWENSVDGMRLTDGAGRIVAVNEAFCRLVQRPRKDLEGRLLTVLYPEGPETEALLEQYRRGFRLRTLEKRAHHRLTLPDGAVRELELSHTFIEAPGRPPLLLSLFRDLTEQRRLEEQLRHAQKMEAIGQLAGGVAHDFNNLLTVIQGNATLLLSAGNLPPAHWHAAHQISQAAERAANLTRQLLTFSRRQVLQPRTLDLNELVHQLSRMLGRVLGEDIVLRLQFSREPAWVMADPGMLEQVVLNLVVNARDAMPEGGQLDVSVRIVEVTPEHLERNPQARPGPAVELSVTDTGCGIPPENLKRIFEPFFTTKEVGKGTGLGLATVYGIVEQHQGWIEVESRVGEGSTFRVFLPHQVPGQPTSEAREEPQLGPQGRETILVVEDEPSVRELVATLLEHHGYRVLQAAHGPEALELWQQHGPQIDLLLTDLVMPRRMNGRQLAERLWQDRPELKVIFTSGYSADVVGRDFVLRPGLVYLQKPYPPGRLAQLVRETLDGTGAAA
ncbi:MAG: PAS domain S-box protein [Limisphaera sp.]|nr:PAS domain S-box protein [Limisphaera sp.]